MQMIVAFSLMWLLTLKRLTWLTCRYSKSEKFTPFFSEFTLSISGCVTNGIKAQVGTLGPLWVERKSKGKSWIK